MTELIIHANPDLKRIQIHLMASLFKLWKYLVNSSRLPGELLLNTKYVLKRCSKQFYLLWKLWGFGVRQQILE